MQTAHVFVIFVILALVAGLIKRQEGFGTSPGTLVQLASTRAEQPVLVAVDGGYDAGNTVLLVLLIVGFVAFLFGLAMAKA
jgi:hypothetical protein